MDMTGKFGQEFTDLIIKHFPNAIKDNPEEIGKASAQVATCLGGLLAFTRRFCSEAEMRMIIRTIVDQIVKNAEIIDASVTKQMGGEGHRLDH